MTVSTIAFDAELYFNFLTIPQTLGGNFSDFHNYMIALEALVRAKGGLRTLGLNGLLKQMIHW
jgi:hypothetical protein